MAVRLSGEDIKNIRKSRKWSTYDLARYLGCNQSTVWRMENGGHISGPAEKLLLALMTLQPSTILVRAERPAA